MASDLVERLREMGRYPRIHFHYQDGADIVIEAAAEVERLRAALSTIQNMATGPTAHEGNLLRQIGDVARKAMEGVDGMD